MFKVFKRKVAEGIELRQLQPEHAEALFQLTQKNRAYLRQWLPWVDRTESPEDPRRFVIAALAQYEENPANVASGIWLDGCLAGCVGTHAIDVANRSSSIGYWIEAGHQGKGVMTRCCATLLDYLFDDMELHRIEIRCGTGNTKSCAIPQRLGFTREGVLRDAEWVNDQWIDLVVWGMLEPDWRRTRHLRAARV
jgi:ribosomal-protein-serine acetyltransferase